MEFMKKTFLVLVLVCSVTTVVFVRWSIVSTSSELVPRHTIQPVHRSYFNISVHSNFTMSTENMTETKANETCDKCPKPAITSLADLRERISALFDLETSLAIYKDHVQLEEMKFHQNSGFYGKPLEDIFGTNYNDNFYTVELQERCAVVGSSGILKKSGCGEEIDSHNFVVRVNLPIIRGFEDDVGSKVDLVASNKFGIQYLDTYIRKNTEKNVSKDKILDGVDNVSCKIRNSSSNDTDVATCPVRKQRYKIVGGKPVKIHKQKISSRNKNVTSVIEPLKRNLSRTAKSTDVRYPTKLSFKNLIKRINNRQPINTEVINVSKTTNIRTRTRKNVANASKNAKTRKTAIRNGTNVSKKTKFSKKTSIHTKNGNVTNASRKTNDETKTKGKGHVKTTKKKKVATSPTGRRQYTALENLNGSIVWLPINLTRDNITSQLKFILNQTMNKKNFNFKVAYSPIPVWPDRIQRFWNKRKCSEGFIAFTIATLFCKKIDLYGFWPFHRDTNGKYIAHHYYDKKWYNAALVNAMPVDFKILNDLNQRGIINIKTDKCSSNEVNIT